MVGRVFFVGFSILFLLLVACSIEVDKQDVKDVEQSFTVRNTQLGISGPQLSVLNPGPNFLKINETVDSSVFKSGLLPAISPILDVQMRDVSICLGYDGYYYMTGSTGDNIWDYNDGIEMWKSFDLKNWDYLGLVWSFKKDATWQNEWRNHRDRKCRSIWSPELFRINNNYYITYSIPPGDRGIFVSTSGKPEGPYVSALKDDSKFEGDIDASLFVDDDGSIYMVYGSGWIVKLKDDLSGVDGKPFKAILENPDTNPDHHAFTCLPRQRCKDIGREGAFLFKNNGIYYLSVADTYQGRYSSMVVTADDVKGPYRNRHEAVPCGGGASFFQDKDGKWFCTLFGNDKQMAWREKPALVQVKLTPSLIKIAAQQPFRRF